MITVGQGVVFGASVVDHLAQRFTITELRREVHLAELRQHSVDTWRGTPYEFPEDDWPWGTYADLCREAIDILRSRQPQPTSGQLHYRIDIAALKSRTDIVVVVERYVTLRKAGRLFKAWCPFHEEKAPSFVVDPDRQSWRCYGACGTGGDVISFIERIENTDFRGAVAILEGG